MAAAPDIVRGKTAMPAARRKSLDMFDMGWFLSVGWQQAVSSGGTPKVPPLLGQLVATLDDQRHITATGLAHVRALTAANLNDA